MNETRARRRIRQAVELFGYRLVSLDWEPLGIVVEKSGQEGGWYGMIDPPYRHGIDILGYNVEHVLDWIDEFVDPIDPCGCKWADPLARKRAQVQTHGPDCRYHLTYSLPWFASPLVEP